VFSYHFCGENFLTLVQINKHYYLTTTDAKENKRVFAEAKKIIIEISNAKGIIDHQHPEDGDGNTILSR